MKYKTLRSYYKLQALFYLRGILLLIVTIMVAVHTMFDEWYIALYLFCGSIICLGIFWYCWSDEFIRKNSTLMDDDMMQKL